MQTIIAAGITMHIRDQGPRDGRVVMFANSLGTDLRIWDAMLPLLPAGLRILRYDMRGHGLTEATPAPYDMELLVGDAAAICDGLGLRCVTFVGLSIGGLVGQALAVARPDLVRALVLMDTAARIGTEQIWQDRIDAVTAGGVAALADAILDRWFTPAFRSTDPTFALWRTMLIRTGVAGYTGCCAAIAGADLTQATRALRLPVMAIAGDQDGSTPPDRVRATADLCGADFHLVADAGHIPCVEQPHATARLLTDFLERTA